jgi:hypothetical protein
MWHVFSAAVPQVVYRAADRGFAYPLMKVKYEIQPNHCQRF